MPELFSPFVPFVKYQRLSPEHNRFCHFVLKEILDVLAEEYSPKTDYIRLLDQYKKEDNYGLKIEQGIKSLEVCPTNYFQHYLSEILGVETCY